MDSYLIPFLFLAWLLGAFWLLSKQACPLALRKFFWPALLLKLSGAVLFIGLYLFYFGKGDVLSYHRQAIKLNEIAHSDWSLYLNLISRYDILPREPLPSGLLHWGNPSSWLLVKIISGLHLLNRNNLWLTALAFGGFGFWGMWRLAVAVQENNPAWGKQALVSLFLVPSVLLWTSGIGKESLFWGGLGLFLASVIPLFSAPRQLSIGSMLAGLLGLWISWQMRYFVVAVLLISLVAWGLTVFVSRRIESLRSLKFQVLVFLGIVAAGAFTAPLLHPNFRASQLVRVIVKSNHDLQQKAQENDVIRYDLQPNFTSLLTNSPKALVAIFFRPWPWEADNLMKWAATLENGVLLVLLVLSISYRYREDREQPPLQLLRFSLWTFVIITALFLSLATPVFGSLHRYRSCFLPAYVFLLLTSQPLMSRLLNWSRTDSKGKSV